MFWGSNEKLFLNKSLSEMRRTNRLLKTHEMQKHSTPAAQCQVKRQCLLSEHDFVIAGDCCFLSEDALVMEF